MNNLTETLTTFISQITQMEKDNEKLNEDIRAIEKEKEAGYKAFNTTTHILLKRDDLDDLIASLDSLECTADTANDEISSAQSSADDAQYTARNAYDEARECFRDLETLMQKAEEEEEEERAVKAPAKKAPAKKVVVSADDVADYKNMMEGGE